MIAVVGCCYAATYIFRVNFEYFILCPFKCLIFVCQLKVSVIYDSAIYSKYIPLCSILQYIPQYSVFRGSPEALGGFS